MTDVEIRTVQLRRYALRAGVMAEFLPWWHSKLVPVREKAGFAIEFAYAIPESNEFVWAVSAPGDAAAFAQIEAAYVGSPERAEAFEGIDGWTDSQVITLVNVEA
ncbi:hypothetical protein EDF46_3052 [Frondihabitans sp. PhB188]|uniref:hypothetical protein n=1 Tax=Frondihabitans sp. PhB188 TaxID=2485200 RepID=UPI000FB578E0|nr:hypothetical protein [Frondihabitans sp. PhB188]ROQ36510.1 hypothetical protein EDF46_3052 [Frondihabitans sp. PhB188]